MYQIRACLNRDQSYYSFMRNVHTGSEAHASTSPTGSGVHSVGVKLVGAKLCTQLHLVPRLSISGVVFN